MKAAQIKNYGGIDAIEINSNAQKPLLQQGQVLVEVHAASLNRIDSAVRNGYLQKMMPLPLPLTLGGDFAGVVTEIGKDVADFKVGDKVYGNAGVYKGGSGSLAEFVASKSENTYFKPTSIDFTKSAAFPLEGASALQGIEEELKVQAGQKILIQGGAGGIGSLAIQIAKMHGAFVATTVGTDDVEFVKNLSKKRIGNRRADYISSITTVEEYRSGLPAPKPARTTLLPRPIRLPRKALIKEYNKETEDMFPSA